MNDATETPANRVAVLIAETQILVANDLADTVREADPHAEITLCHTQNELRCLLHNRATRFDMAFVTETLALTTGPDPMLELIRANTRQVVVIGDPTELSDPGTEVLPKPFTSEMVERLFRRLNGGAWPFRPPDRSGTP